MRRLALFGIGIGLGIFLNVLGGVAVVPAPAPCPGCAILSQPYSCHDAEAVSGGYICAS